MSDTLHKDPWPDIERRVKDTVGYHEAECKKSFMVGARITFDRTITKLDDLVGIYQRNNRYLTEENKELLEDLTTLSKIIDKYKTR
jgi:hypothetical protein